MRRFLFLSLCLTASVLVAAEKILDYDAPAGTWNAALPLGNGRLGAMFFGLPGNERLQLNEDTLWAGGPNCALNPRMKALLPRIRSRILAGDPEGAFDWFGRQGEYTSSNGSSFAYQTIGSLRLKFSGHDFPSAYHRTLSLEEAVADCRYTLSDTVYRREVFASLADDVIFIRLTASKPQSISFMAFWESPHQRFAQSTQDGTDLLLEGRGSEQFGVEGKVRFRCRLVPVAKGGRVTADNGVLFVDRADEVVLILSAATSFKDWKDGSSGDEKLRCDECVNRVRGLAYDEARRRHVTRYRDQFGRCVLDLGPDPFPGKTVPARLADFRRTRDPHLAELYFAFGRYLLISSSQPGTQPPTLQGIWNEWLQPPWQSSYTVNINLEMNY